MYISVYIYRNGRAVLEEGRGVPIIGPSISQTIEWEVHPHTHGMKLEQRESKTVPRGRMHAAARAEGGTERWRPVAGRG